MLGHHELQIWQALGGIQGWLNAFGGLRKKLKLRPFIYLNMTFKKYYLNYIILF